MYTCCSALKYLDQLLINAVIGNLRHWDWTCPVLRAAI
jgi:hypothetical protein